MTRQHYWMNARDGMIQEVSADQAVVRFKRRRRDWASYLRGHLARDGVRFDGRASRRRSDACPQNMRQQGLQRRLPVCPRDRGGSTRNRCGSVLAVAR